MTPEEFWQHYTEMGRQAHREGKANDACPGLIGRAQAAWHNGWSQEFGRTPKALANEKKALAAVKRLRKEQGALNNG